MSKHVLEMRTVVNETDLSRLAGKWFAFMRDLEKKTVAEVYVAAYLHAYRCANLWFVLH